MQVKLFKEYSVKRSTVNKDVLVLHQDNTDLVEVALMTLFQDFQANALLFIHEFNFLLYVIA